MSTTSTYPYSNDASTTSQSDSDVSAYVIVIVVIVLVKIGISIACCHRYLRHRNSGSVSPDPRFRTWDNPGPTHPVLSMDKFLDDIDMEKPIRFTSQHLWAATDRYTRLLGVGGFGSVYKGSLTNGVSVAVKVLRGGSDKRVEEQFMAEVSTIGRIHHLNLVRLYGFCYERDLRALVYEYMDNGSLDQFLFGQEKNFEWDKRHKIAVGTAKGIMYLHEECKQRIVHYDIKPSNVLLDASFCPKVADFGLAKLCNRDNTHLSMTGLRGTPGYAAPEMWMPMPITHKCDVYSYGMLLFEVFGMRRNVDTRLSETQEWFPMWVWRKFERGEVGDAMAACGIEEKDWEEAERMVMTALWCVQYRAESRPLMSEAVKMLEGGIQIPAPPPNPFPHLVASSGPANSLGNWQSWTTSCSSDHPSVKSSTPIMRKFEIEMASS